MRKYVVWKPGLECYAKVYETETAFDARVIVARAQHLETYELCAMRLEHLGFVGAKVRELVEKAIGKE